MPNVTFIQNENEMTREEHLTEAKKLLTDAISSASMGLLSMTFPTENRISKAIDHLMAAMKNEVAESDSTTTRSQ